MSQLWYLVDEVDDPNHTVKGKPTKRQSVRRLSAESQKVPNGYIVPVKDDCFLVVSNEWIKARFADIQGVE